MFMNGTAQGLRDLFFKDWLQEVPLNKLELALLQRHLENPAETAEQVADTLQRARLRLMQDQDTNRRAIKCLDRVLPLFEKHEFWSTQPVMHCYEPIHKANEPIEHKTLDDVAKEPYSLPQEYHWCELDMTNQAEVDELYELLTEHYVEDDGGTFRFDYSREFLVWALTPPGYKKEWILGVRGGKQNKLYGFISGIPV